MINEPALKFGIHIALVGIGVTFGSLIFLYFLLRAFLRYERRAAAKEEKQKPAGEPIPEELVAVIGVAIEKYLEQDREYISPQWRLELKPASAWKISGRQGD